MDVGHRPVERPRAESRSRTWSISGLPATSISGLGVHSVSGRIRVPRPAAMTIAVSGTSAGTSARSRRRLVDRGHVKLRRPRSPAKFLGDVSIEPLADRLQPGRGEVALEQAPHARLELAVAGLAVALPQPREHARGCACCAAPRAPNRRGGNYRPFPVAATYRSIIACSIAGSTSRRASSSTEARS